MEENNSFIQRFKLFFIKCGRVLALTKRPDGLEFKTIVKASAAGIAVIGLLGFLVQMTKVLIFR